MLGVYNTEHATEPLPGGAPVAVVAKNWPPRTGLRRSASRDTSRARVAYGVVLARKAKFVQRGYILDVQCAISMHSTSST